MDQANLSTNPVETPPEPRAKKHWGLGLAIGGAVLLLAIASFFAITRNQGLFKQEQAEPEVSSEIIVEITEEEEELIELEINPLANQFAPYNLQTIKVNPAIPKYPLESNLSNITNLGQFYLSDQDKEMLARNQFIVRPDTYLEFFPLYESNRYNKIPSFITTDSILHNYHLLFDFLLKQLEEQKLSAGLKKLSQQMFASALDQYKTLQGTTWEEEARRNVAFFAVGNKLLDPEFVIPSLVATEVNQELEAINKHEDLKGSPVMKGSTDEVYLEDYTQYIPRGHYTKSEELERYFRTMMWYGRFTFVSDRDSQLKSALLMTLALDEEANLSQWKKLYEPINFFVGKSDDLTYEQMIDLITQVYGEEQDLVKISQDQASFSRFSKAVNKLEGPKINSIPVFIASLDSDREALTKGFRFMGQRFTVDAEIFQRLITREVGPKGGSCEDAPFDEGRMLPQGLDIPAALGSSEAEAILESQGEKDYACYPENLSKLQVYLKELPENHWQQNLYWGWLYQLRPLLEERGEGYPVFMQSSAWTRKSLSAFLGSWAELKHDTILYAKQVYAEFGGGFPPDNDDRGYVEPNPEVYARLSALLEMTISGLESRDLLVSDQKDNLLLMKQLADSLRVISEKELANESLSEEEYEIIRSYGGQLEHIWLEINKNEPEFINSTGARDYLDQNPAAVITDVATDPNGAVLEAGIGNIFNIFVIVPIEGQLRLARGGVFSYYEFPWPMNDRLTDEKWRAMIRPDSNIPLPKLPQWTSAYLVSSQD